MKVAFHTNQMCLRGTEIAIYDYAKYNREFLNNESIIFCNANNELVDTVVEKIKENNEDTPQTTQTTDTTQTTAVPPPSFASQLTGLGITGLSLAKLLGG